jgi:hypothetical protein
MVGDLRTLAYLVQVWPNLTAERYRDHRTRRWL